MRPSGLPWELRRGRGCVGERGIMGNVVLRSPVPSHSQPQALGLLLDPKLVTPCYLPERDDKGLQTWDLKAIVSGLEMFFYFKIFLLSTICQGFLLSLIFHLFLPNRHDLGIEE